MMTNYSYSYKCKRDGLFEVDSERPSTALLIWAVMTLGLSYVILTYYRLAVLWWKSKCPVCGKRSWRLLITCLAMMLMTVEFCSMIYYFNSEGAQHQLVMDASMSSLPEGIEFDQELDNESFWKVMSYVWVAELLPQAGVFIVSYTAYLLLGWFSFVVIMGMYVQSRHIRSH